jgi:phosphatidylglycerol---prolipoprotein diacylglyceryl transferase
MYPRLFTIPLFRTDFTLHTYGVLLAIAFIVGLWVVGRQARRSGMDAGQTMDLAVYSLIGGLIGARLLLLVVDWDTYSKNPRELFSLLQSGGVFYGGLIGGLLVAWWYIRRHAIPGWRAADVLAPGVVMGQAIGRLGCLAAGCCFGKPTDVPWAVTFRDMWAARQAQTPVDVPLHPSQVYESIAAALIFVVLVWMAPRKRFHGQIALAYIVLYSAARFGLEYFRGDVSRGFVGPLSTSQVIALLLLVGAVALVPYLSKRQRAGAAPSAEPTAAA